MKKLIRSAISALSLALLGVMAYAQVTTSSLNGIVTDESLAPLPGAVVTAVHTPSGTKYYAVVNEKGQYHIYGMRSGGPYKVEISFLGMTTEQHNDVTLALGEPTVIDATLRSDNQLDSVTLFAERSFRASLNGAGASYDRSQLDKVPTIERSIYDVAKLTPLVSTNKNGGISIAGTNNRYNAFTVDGADAKDSFGLTQTGTNGGQTGANPISLDAIEEVQVAIAPFDVRQANFTGGAINAVTKSGTNAVKGSVYGFFYNQNLVGTTAGSQEDMQTNFNTTERTKYSEQLYRTLGATVGAPIVKDKAFVFLSLEHFKLSTPNIYSPDNNSYENKDLVNPVEYGGKTYSHFTSELAQILADYYQRTYNPQGKFSEAWSPRSVNTNAINALGRLDWNINDANKLMVRFQLMDAKKEFYSSSANSYMFNNSSLQFVNRTYTVVGELNSRLSDAVHNNLRVSLVMERDHREVPYQGANISISGDKPSISLGTETYSGANSMDCDTWTLTDNLSIFKGNHNITVGTENKFFRFNNLFLQYAYGGYTFASVADFLANNPSQFNYRYCDPDLTGGNPLWAANTNLLQLGAYVQDEWRPNSRFTLTYGLRADMPIFLNKPTENPVFNATSYARNNGEYVGTVPQPSLLLSPRVGFRWWVDDSHTTLIRGGLGLFTGQPPLVWFSNAYNNTGMEAKSVTVNNPVAVLDGFKFTSNPYEDLVKPGVVSGTGSGATINTLNKKFKYPQSFRVNLGLEQDLGAGFKFSFDAIYAKTLNNVLVKNLAITSIGKVYAVDAATAASNPASAAAPYYALDSGDYYVIVALANTNKGHTYTLSGKLEKHFNFGLDLMAGYTFGHSYSVNDGSASIAYSNWTGNHSVDSNSPELSYSVFDRPHRIIALASYTSPTYGRFMSTSIVLTYEGQSGQRYSYTYSEAADFNGDGRKGNSLLYVPTADEIGRMTWADATDAQKFEAFIQGDSYLNSHRGQYTQRFAGMAPFEHHFDLHLSQNFFYDKKSGRKVELMADVLNIGNLFNRAWGLYYAATNNRSPLRVTAVTKTSDGNAIPTYAWFGQTGVNLNDLYSRWRCQLGLRLTF